MNSAGGKQCAVTAMASTSSVAAAASIAPAGRIKKRRFSSARIQPTRIKKVMQSDEDIGRMVHSVPVAVGSVMEHFAKKLLEAAADSVHNSGARTLAPSHIRHAVSEIAAFTFLEPLLNNLGVPTAPNTANSQRYAPPSKQHQPQHDLIALPHYQVKAGVGRGKKKEAPSAPSGPPTTGGEKRSRGRPRKNAQAKYIDDEVEPNDNDRLLMPPPRMMPPAGLKANSSPLSGNGNGGTGSQT